MTKKKLSKVALAMKKQSVTSKQYTDLMIDASKLHKYEKGTPNTGFLKTIILSAAKTQAAAEADANRIEIDIPKDFLVKKNGSKLLTVAAGTGANEGKLMVVAENSVALDAAEQYEAPATVTAAGQWIDLVINTKDGSETDDHLSINVNSLVDVYTNGNGLNLDNKVFSIKLRMGANDAANSGLAFDANGALYISIGTGNGLSVDGNGLNLALAVASTKGVGGSAGAMSAEDKENLDNLVEDSDLSLVTDAEIASWYGFDITGTPEAGSDAEAVKNALAAVSDDSITDEE